MPNSKHKDINNLLDNDRFVAWVTSGYKTDNAYWSNKKASLSKSKRKDFEKAESVLIHLKTLHIDDQKSVKSRHFINNQYTNLMDDFNAITAKKPKVFRIGNFLKYAAVLVVLISVVGLLYISKEPNNTFASNLDETQFNESELLIKTPENKYFKISNTENKSWLADNGISVQVNADAIRFTNSENLRISEHAPYEIIVPKGKTYLLTLVDSTVVELNENSRISFNNSTILKERTIDLEGEAFFDVTHNKERPFIVHSSDLNIEVLGTEFNVSNYEDSDFTSTTLIDGAINVSTQQGESKVIRPGTQATLYHNQSEIIVEKVNVQQAVSWTTSRMIFQDETLENIIAKLGSWYPENFVLKSEKISQYRFTGTLKKENELSHFLQILKYTEGINYEIKDKEVVLFFN